MAKIDIDKVKAGMVLAKDARDSQGRLLAPKGAVLTTGQVEALANRGVKRVAVSAPELEPQPLTPEEIKELKNIFSLNDLKHPFVVMLLKDVVGRRVRVLK